MANIYYFILFVYIHYIQEDWDIYTKWGKRLIKPAWFVRSILVWTLSIVFFPVVLLHMDIVKNDRINKMISEMF